MYVRMGIPKMITSFYLHLSFLSLSFKKEKKKLHNYTLTKPKHTPFSFPQISDRFVFQAFFLD